MAPNLAIILKALKLKRFDKVMAMGGWEYLKTMQIYIRKTGVNVDGIADTLDLHSLKYSKVEGIKFVVDL